MQASAGRIARNSLGIREELTKDADETWGGLIDDEACKVALIAVAAMATTAQAGAPLKSVDVKLGKAHTSQAKTKAPVKPHASATAKPNPKKG